MKKENKRLQGIISISAKGTGYVKIDGFEKDIEIDFKKLNTALHGDLVEIVIYRKDKKNTSGEVIKIIKRLKSGFSGILEKEPHFTKTSQNNKKDDIFFLKPDDTKMYTDILIPKDSLGGAKLGQKVYGEIIYWKDSSKSPIGKIIKILGKKGENNAEMHAIAIEKGFDNDLPTKVEEEARKIKNKGIKKEDYEGRRDFRKILTFTIDPNDAKDFDDAISFKEIENDKYEIGIHIADVSHYVKIGSEIDKEARKRATSVYLVDRTIPMLPEVLSNDLCSLLPHKDRLTMSAVFVLDKNAKILKEWYGKTVIHSKKRFTYEEAEKILKTGHQQKTEYYKELSILNNLAKKLNKERFKNGAISLEQDEVKFILDQNGIPTKVIKKERGDSNKLIEEFMLLANRKVAETIYNGIKKVTHNDKNISNVLIYRVHDMPSKEKMEDLAFFLRSLGYKISLINGIIPINEINNLLKNLSTNENIKNTVERAVVRSMAKAIYSTKNIGHYGLAFKYYTHFTSPIRRYPDIVIHRLLDLYLNGKIIGEIQKQKGKTNIYEEISKTSSDQEKNASEAERSSIKYKQVEYMSKRISKSFWGVISGVTEWGLYVEEIETKCEGLVRVKEMKDDFYIFNEKKLELVGQKKKRKYRLGDKIKIKVQNVDLERKTIDYVLA